MQKVLNITKSGKPLNQCELPKEVKKLIGSITGGAKWKKYLILF